MAGWWLDPDYAHLEGDFGSLNRVFALDGEFITRDPVSSVIRVSRNGVRFYIKRYTGGGKGARRYLGRSRVKAEWQNLRYFESWGIPTAHVVACGLERRFGLFRRGAIITRELPETTDLAVLAKASDPRLKDTRWVDKVSRQLARATRTMHEHNFVHNDLKWRNLLVNQQGELFFIDCPGGTFWSGSPLRYRIVKDLACLDKVAKYQLSRTRRLRFYLQYREHERLTPEDKDQVRRILRFFEGRE